MTPEEFEIASKHQIIARLFALYGGDQDEYEFDPKHEHIQFVEDGVWFTIQTHVNYAEIDAWASRVDQCSTS